MKIAIINGVNLNMLGRRDKNQYGEFTLSDLENLVIREFPDVDIEFYQSNIEGEIVEKIQNARENTDALIINPGAYSHTSVAIRDALEILKIPKVEVHLSNVSAREDFRRNLITAPVCDGYLSGFREDGYLAGVYLCLRLCNK